jgi:hypothetical protein
LPPSPLPLIKERVKGVKEVEEMKEVKEEEGKDVRLRVIYLLKYKN